MKELTKKRILIRQEQQAAPLGSFFRELGFGLCTEFKQDEIEDYLFIVDDYLSEVTVLPRIQTQKEIATDCSSAVRGYFDESHLADENVKTVIAAYFNQAQSDDLLNRFSDKFKNVFTLKIHDYLNVGYFIDSIIVEAYKNNFDCDKIRNYLNHAFSYALKLTEQEVGHPPIEVSFCHNEIGFVVQVSSNATGLNWRNSFSLNNENVYGFSTNANYFDVSYFSKREKILFSSLWFKNESIRDFRSVFFTEVSDRKTVVIENSELINQLDHEVLAVDYKPKVQEREVSSQLYFAIKACNLIREHRSNQKYPVDLSILSIADIDDYLSLCAQVSFVKAIELDTKNFILKLLKNDILLAKITNYIQEISQSNLDPHMAQLQKNLSKKTLAQIEEMLFLQDGHREHTSVLDNESGVMRARGWADVTTEESWKVKRSALIENINEQVTLIKSTQKNIVADDLIRIVSKNLGTDPLEVKTVIDGLIAETVSSFISADESLGESAALKDFTDKTNQQENIHKLHIQIIRMKDFIKNMKNEFDKIRANTVIAKELAEKDKLMAINNLRVEFENKMVIQNEVNLKLQAKVLAASRANNGDLANQDLINSMKDENAKLKVQIKNANQKIENLNDNIENLDSSESFEMLESKEKELLIVTKKLELTNAVVSKYQKEFLKLGEKVEQAEERCSILINEKNLALAGIKDSTQNNDYQFEKKILEEKIRDQGILVKQLQHKLKLSMSQLDELSKAKPAVGSGTAKGNDIYLKQIESFKLRIIESNAEVLEKKKEAIKLNSENTQLRSKLAEVERKLENIDKKAS